MSQAKLKAKTGHAMYYVYILTSKSSNHTYVGYTRDLKRRVKEHNDPSNKRSTSRYAPWKLECYIALDDKQQAKDLELYLKSHSGRAFMKKRLILS